MFSNLEEKLNPKYLIMKKIIVPVDFSIHSEYALQTAAFLAKQANAEIIVCTHVRTI